MKILITGLNGFIGHHVAEHILENTDWDIVGLDRIDATSTLHRLRQIKNWTTHAHRVEFVWHDLRAAINPTVANEIGDIDVVLHLAASTHVDRSITDPLSFVQDNVIGTAHILEWARERQPGLFINFSTDEVFGPAAPGENFQEWDRFNAGNPYAAAKAGAEQLACAYANTYQMRIITTFTMNVFGERQHPEKFIPNTIAKILKGEKVLIHANQTKTLSGSRFYLHAGNVGKALHFLVDVSSNFFTMKEGGASYHRCNIVGDQEVTNLEMAQMISEIMEENLIYEMVDFHSSRPGHDLRYALDGSKLRDAGFKYPMSFKESLERTVRWYMEHKEWLKQ